MASRAICLLLLASCGGNARPARDRVLEQVPADVTMVVAADARALAHPRLRAVVDGLRSELPAGFECVVDAAIAGEAVAAGAGPAGVTLALITRVPVDCAALSRIEDELYMATLGAGAPAAGASVLTAKDHARARPYLREAPVAVFVAREDMRVLATAQPEPLAAWAAIDTHDATALHDRLRAALATAATDEALAPLARAITLERTGSQVVARLGAVTGDLAVPVRAALDRARAMPKPIVLGRVVVSSLATAAGELVAARKEPVIVNGRFEGMRLHEDLARYSLAANDILVAIDGKRLTRVEHVATVLSRARQRTTLLVRRAQRFQTIDIVEQ